MRSHDTPRNFDEWPNLSEVDKHPTVEKHDPLVEFEPDRVHPARVVLALALAFIVAALLVKALWQ